MAASKDIPQATIEALARSLCKEASSYGFSQLDFIRLVNEIMEACDDSAEIAEVLANKVEGDAPSATEMPLEGGGLKIVPFDEQAHLELLNSVNEREHINLKALVEQKLAAYNFVHTTIEFEFPAELCRDGLN